MELASKVPEFNRLLTMAVTILPAPINAILLIIFRWDIFRLNGNSFRKYVVHASFLTIKHTETEI